MRAVNGEGREKRCFWRVHRVCKRALIQPSAGLILILIALGTAWVVFAKDSPPKAAAVVMVDRIEIAEKYVTVHWDIDANRSYTLQAATNLTSPKWSNIYVYPSRPFANHWIVADERTNAMRFYRLLVRP